MFEKLSISNQTLQEFIDRPFGMPNKQKQLKYSSRYEEYAKNNKIRIESSIEIDKNYFIHLHVPSESQKGLAYYDVVVQFFTPSEKIQRELNVKNYYVQFFSNSPGFVYKYASLYKIEGYLIESLCSKFPNGTLDTLPEKANKDFELYYDSSIYYACRYLLDNSFSVLGKLSLKIFKTKRPEAFFRDIQDIEGSEIERNIAKLERNIKAEIKHDTELSREQELKLQKNSKINKQILHRKEAKRSTKSTMANSSGIKKIIPSSHTKGGSQPKRISSIKKKTASKTTRHK